MQCMTSGFPITPPCLCKGGRNFFSGSRRITARHKARKPDGMAHPRHLAGMEFATLSPWQVCRYSVPDFIKTLNDMDFLIRDAADDCQSEADFRFSHQSGAMQVPPPASDGIAARCVHVGGEKGRRLPVLIAPGWFVSRGHGRVG